MPLQYRPAATGAQAKPGTLPQIPSPGNNSFLGDVFNIKTTETTTELSSGFYRQEAGEALVYTYTYDELKVFLEVSGEYTISDETGQKVDVKPGDTFFFPKGTTITFSSTGYGLAYFVGARGPLGVTY